MIHCGKEHTEIEGSIVQICNDLTNIIMAVKNVLYDSFNQEEADAIIAMCGKLAYTDDKKQEELISEDIARIFDTVCGEKDEVHV